MHMNHRCPSVQARFKVSQLNAAHSAANATSGAVLGNGFILKSEKKVSQRNVRLERTVRSVSVAQIQDSHRVAVFQAARRLPAEPWPNLAVKRTPYSWLRQLPGTAYLQR